MNQKVKFPRRSVDGTFCVAAVFFVASQDLVQLQTNLQTWLQEWVDKNRSWTWNFETGGEQTFYYTDEFRSVPLAEILSASEIQIKLFGQPTSQKMWKDWLVLKIIPDIKHQFPEIQGVLRINDC